MKLLVILSTCLILGAQSAVLKVPEYLGGRIVGGEATYIENHPYTVSLRRGSFHFCGGIIVSRQTVLTAAHCVSSPVDLSVNAGSTYNDKVGVLSTVDKVLRHPQYLPQTSDFDFALLILSKPLTFSSKIESVDLPAQDEAPLANGTLVNVSGWGDTLSSSESDIQLRNVVVPIVDLATCQDRYKGYTVTDRMICAGQTNGGKDSCQGDSGGPLVRDNTVYGVVSWGIGCAEPGYPGVYASVPSAVDWIKKNLL